jgi:hypothetical protein
MPSYAVTLAGIPAPTSSGVLQDLKNRFNDGYVFRTAAAATANGSLTNYSERAVDMILEAARDAVFGSSRRPSGFCRNPSQNCVLKGNHKKHCNKSTDDMCYLTKPDFLIVMFQGGKNEEILLNKLHYCAHLVRIPENCYGKRQNIVNFVVSFLQSSKSILNTIAQEIKRKNSPLLLPPNNFKGERIKQLLASASKGDFYKAAKLFRSEFFSSEILGYLARKRQLAFTPAESEIQHGIAGPQTRADLALSRYHRLGCTYARGMHYDVIRTNGHHFDGSIEFTCRDSGAFSPTTGKNVNILVDDCAR